MQTLTLSQCKDYVRNIKDLELSCYQQEQLIKELKNWQLSGATQKKISELEHRLRTEKEPVKPLSLIGEITGCIVGSFIGAIIGIVTALIVRVFLAIFSSQISLFSSPWRPYIFWGAVIGYAIMFVLWLYANVIGEKARQAKEKYPQELEAYHQKQQEIKDLIEHEREIFRTTIPNKIQESEKTYQQTKKILQEYYNKGFIYPKYRGLVPMCTIYEYLESGRCFSLLGHEGAYNLYESELRMNTIIGKLDDVIDRLDSISASQQLLAQEIRQCNAQLSRISSTLDNIENNTALAQYYSSVTASNTTFMSWLAVLDYDK